MHEKKLMLIRFDKNYNKISKNEFFIDLPPSLQKQVIKTLTAHELYHFTYLFQDFGISGLEFKVSKDIIVQLFEVMQCEIYEFPK
jgi:hypothetical protein